MATTLWSGDEIVVRGTCGEVGRVGLLLSGWKDAIISNGRLEGLRVSPLGWLEGALRFPLGCFVQIQGKQFPLSPLSSPTNVSKRTVNSSK